MTKGQRNAPCPCGSGIKYKNCCLQKDRNEKNDAIDSMLADGACIPPPPGQTWWSVIHIHGRSPADCSCADCVDGRLGVCNKTHSPVYCSQIELKAFAF